MATLNKVETRMRDWLSVMSRSGPKSMEKSRLRIKRKSGAGLGGGKRDTVGRMDRKIH